MQGIKYLMFFCCGSLLTLIIGFSWSAWNRGADIDPWIELHVENQTDQSIARIHIETFASAVASDSEPRIGVTEYFDIKQHSQLILPVAFYRKGSYQIEFELADGTICRRKNSYVEPGAFIFEVLEKINESC